MLTECALIGGIAVGYQVRKKSRKELIISGYILKQRLQKKLGRLSGKNIRNSENKDVQLSASTLGVTGLSFFFPILQPISLALLVCLCMPVVRSAWGKLRREKKLGHDFLVSILAAVGLLSAQFFALSIALVFYYLGRNFLFKTQNHTKLLLTELFHQKSDNVWLVQDNVELQVRLEQVNVGDKVVVHTGEIIPVDGRVLTGIIVVDQHQLTGESQPAEKTAGDAVFASSQVLHGTATIEVEKTGSNTTAVKITDILASTADHKLSMLSQGEIWSDRIALPLLCLSAVMSPFLGVIGASAILNCTFGNRLQLTAPLTVLHHLKLATERGVMIKDGRALETLCQVDTVLFDKTGTLTTDQPYVSEIVTFSPDYSEQRLLLEAAAAELKLSHPIAKAIIAKAHEEEITLPEIDYESDVTFEIGLGVQAVVSGNLIQVGSQRFIEAQGISISAEIQHVIEAAYKKCHSVVFLASGSEIKGILQIAPTIRAGMEASLQKLRQQGIQHLAIVSGDQQEPTRNVAQTLGIDEFFAEVLPEQKADIIKKLQKQGRTVCFIGDGINDTIAMKCADVSVSIDGSSSIACDLAQIVFMDGSLYHLNDLFALAFSLNKNMKNTMLTLYTPTLINLFGAFFLGFGLMATVLVNNAALLLALKKTKQNYLENVSQ